MGIKRLYNNFSITTKLIISYLSISLIAVLLMAFYSYHFYSQATQEDFNSITNDATQTLNYQIENYLNQIQLSTATLIAGPISYSGLDNNILNGLIQRWLNKDIVLSPVERTFIEASLNNYIALNYSDIDGLYLMSMDSKVLSNLTNTDEQAILRSPWFNTPFTDQLKVIPTHRSHMSGNYVLSLLVPIHSILDVKLVGRLVIDLKLSEIERIMSRTQLGETGYFYILSSDNTIVYHPNEQWIGKPLHQTNLASLKMNSEKVVQQLNNKKVLLTNNYSNHLEWNTVALVPYGELASGLDIAKNSFVIVTVIIVTFILIVVPLLSKWLVRPILNLKQLMHRVEVGDLHVRAEISSGKDEIQLLNKSFNKMINRLNGLINQVSAMKLNEVHMQLRQKEALIQALQNQINPHLLYNTLDIIKSIAYLENVKQIEIIAKNLAEVYRYTARFDTLEVSLEEELNNLRKYLDIAHVRFPHNFQSGFYVNEKFYNTNIVKFSLQPTVENAVKYAIEPNGGKGAILISAFQQNNDLVIEIADNGSGIPNDRLEELTEQLNYITCSVDNDFIQQDSLGLANVHARIILQYGKRYGISLTSFPGIGTVVSIRVPYKITE